MNTDYLPLLLCPSSKDYLWGGKRLDDEFEKKIDMTPLVKTWECSPTRMAQAIWWGNV